MLSHVEGPRRLTIAMIVRDAAPIMGESIASIRNIADEIVIVDTGSTDQTRNIAKRLATKVIDFHWCDDFAAARNAALPHISGEWILWLDAGEIVSNPNAIALRNFVDRTARSDTSYLVAIEVPPKRTGTAGEQVTRLRLIPNRNDISFIGRVREQIQFNELFGALKVELAPGAIQRTLREHDATFCAQRATRNLRIAELEIAENGGNARTQTVRGEALTELGMINEAIGAFQQAIKMTPKGSTEMLEAFYGWLTAYDATPNGRDEQIAVATAALDSFPFDAQLLCAVGGYMQATGRIDLAARSYQVAAEHGQVNIETWHLPNIAEVAITCWALSLEMIGKREQALELMENIARTTTPSVPVLRHLIDMYIVRDQRQKGLELIRHLKIEGSMHDAMRTAVRGACMAAKQNWSAAIQYLQSAYDSGLRDLLCLRWLATSLLASGEYAKARAIAIQWKELDPESLECVRAINLCELNVKQAASIPRPLSAPIQLQPAISAMNNIGERQSRVDLNRSTMKLAFSTMGLPNVTLVDANRD